MIGFADSILRIGGTPKPSGSAARTVQVLNDQGYSLMLRGDLSGARKKFTKALSLDPGNPIIANNLELLNGRRCIERPPNHQP